MRIAREFVFSDYFRRQAYVGILHSIPGSVGSNAVAADGAEA